MRVVAARRAVLVCPSIVSSYVCICSVKRDSLGVVMKAKVSFLGGMVLGLLAGSRIGPELYRRVSAGVSSVASNPQVRKGASAASDRAAHAAKTAGTSAAQQVKHAGEVVAHRFGDRWNHGEQHPAHSLTNGSSHGVATGSYDEDPFVD